jgi:hypothetical protein
MSPESSGYARRYIRLRREISSLWCTLWSEERRGKGKEEEGLYIGAERGRNGQGVKGIKGGGMALSPGVIFG